MPGAVPITQEFPMPFKTSALLVLLCITTLHASAAEEDVQIEPTSPKAALKSLYQALEVSDSAVVRNLLYASSDPERQLADAFAAQLAAAKSLGDAASKKYGATGDALSKGMPVRDQIAQLSSAQVTTDGDTATVKIPSQPNPLRLKKVDGNWKIVVADYAGDNLAGQTTVMKEMTTVFNAVAADINADKLPTPADAQKALQLKLQAVLYNTLTKHVPPATTRSTTTKPASAH
jgi:hypothetical protein